MDKKTKEMIDDIRSTPNSFLTREGCLELFETIEQQQEENRELKEINRHETGSIIYKWWQEAKQQLQEKDAEIEGYKSLLQGEIDLRKATDKLLQESRKEVERLKK